jgi:hypothetical protein
MISIRRPVLAAEYQEKTRGIGFLSWSSWHGCYVIFHVQAHDYCFGYVQAMLFIVMIRYHHVWMIRYHSRFVFPTPGKAW